MAKPGNSDVTRFIFSPESSGALGAEYIRIRRESRSSGVRLGLRSMDEERNSEIMLPLLPGELMSVLGRPGNGKTGFMIRWARYRANWLTKNKIEGRVVLYITLEQTIEELQAFHIAATQGISITAMARGSLTDTQWQRVLKAGISGRYTPLWFLGYSTINRPHGRITIDVMHEAMEHLSKTVALDLVLVDYLQRIPYQRGAESKTIGVSDNLDELAEMALQFGVPVVVGVQARREVDSYELPVPGLDDGQWSSNIEQTSSKVLSLVRPRSYKKEGELFGGIRVEGRNQIMLSLLKQKLGPSNFVRNVYFDPVYNILDDNEIRYESLREDGENLS